MISAQWHFGLLGQYYWLDAISQFHFKIPIKVQLGFIKVCMKRDDERRSKALKEKLNLISFNTSLENPLAAVPVRWYLIKEEVNKQSWEENEKLIKRMSVWSRHGPKPTYISCVHYMVFYSWGSFTRTSLLECHRNFFFTKHHTTSLNII